MARTTMAKMKSFTKPPGSVFYISKGLVTERGKPEVSVSWWDTVYVLRKIEKQYGLPEGSIELPTLYESLTAAGQDREIHDSIFKFPAEWQRNLILNPNAPTETDDYILMDNYMNSGVLKKSKTPRNLVPVSRYKKGEFQVVTVNVFDIPFELIDGRYNPEDIDPNTGFLTELDPDGGYEIWFGKDERLYAMLLIQDGDIVCSWEPGYPDDRVGFRGSSTGNLPPVLLESETDVLKSELERTRLSHSREMDTLYKDIEELETHYKSDLQKLQALKKKIKHK